MHNKEMDYLCIITIMITVIAIINHLLCWVRSITIEYKVANPKWIMIVWVVGNVEQINMWKVKAVFVICEKLDSSNIDQLFERRGRYVFFYVRKFVRWAKTETNYVHVIKIVKYKCFFFCFNLTEFLE